MKRSVIQLAGKTLLISMPKAWVTAHHVLKGQELEMYPDAIFSEKTYGEIGGIRFCTAPNEILAFESQYSKHLEDKRLGSELHCDKELFKQIKYTVLRGSRKDG